LALISKYKTLLPFVKDIIGNTEKFMSDYKMNCPAAQYRLIKIGVPGI
jgi:ESCRT-I complex subunit VPS28